MMTRILRTVDTTLSHTFYIGRTPTDPTGTPTATVNRLDGTQVATGNAGIVAGKGQTTFPLPGQDDVDVLTVDWTAVIAGDTRTERDYVEIVGGYFFELQEAYDELRLDPAKYPLATVESRRTLVEQECEAIRRQAQVPRFARFLVDGSGSDELIVPDFELRTLRAAKVADRAGGTFVDLTADQLAAVAAEPSGLLIRDDGSCWPRGRRNVIVEYEYGLDAPTRPIRDAAIRRLRYWLDSSRTAVPDRAITWTTNEGGTYRLTQAGPFATGMPDVDAAYQRDANERVWIA